MTAISLPTIRILNESEAHKAIPALCAVLIDCVEGGASVGFMSPLDDDQANAYWTGVADAVGQGAILLLVAERDGMILGTVQLGLKLPPNQPHRADLNKLLVHRRGRGAGLARGLMLAAEHEARNQGRSLLVLNTATGSPAEAIYARLDWQRVGIIPDYALFPDGRSGDCTFFYKTV